MRVTARANMHRPESGGRNEQVGYETVREFGPGNISCWLNRLGSMTRFTEHG
jgi:hypothetical protein